MHPSSLKRFAGAAVLLALAGVPIAHAESFTFGVIGDTQWSGTDLTGNNVNTVAVNQIKAANEQFVAAGVKFVVQVGDLCDANAANNAALQTRLNANTALNSAGIAFYGLRGNHESGSGSKTFFQANYIPTSNSTAAVSVAAFDSATYSVTYNNTKIVLLDYGVMGSTTNLNSATTWIGSELSAADYTQSFVFGHKNLLGQNHKDSLFGSSNDANPAQQNNFLGTLQSNDVHYYISGHDHMHHRAQVTSPDGLSSVQQIITASDSYKYYTPNSPYSTRETANSQELGKTGYYLYTVDGPRVTGKYYATTPQANGDVASNPVWQLHEVFGYSLNGTSKQVAAGASYAMTHSIAAGTRDGESGYVGTAMAILAGTNGSTATAGGRATSKDVNVGWAPSANGPAGATSDVLTLWGMSDLSTNGTAVDKTDPYALSLTFAADQLSAAALAAGEIGIAGKDESGAWFNAVTLNYGGTAQFVTGAWNSSYTLGTYGLDLNAAGGPTAWAVLDYAGEFAVTSFTAIPEPSTYAAFFGAAALVFVGVRRFRRRAA